MERFKTRVRELWNARRSRTSNQLRDEWNRYVRGWWDYYRLAGMRASVRDLEAWVRRHIRKCFWLRWHDARGRLRRLRQLGITENRDLGVVHSSRGAWAVSVHPVLNTALSKAVLRRYGFLFPSGLEAG